MTCQPYYHSNLQLVSTVTSSNTKDYSGLIKIIVIIVVVAVAGGAGVLLFKILYPKLSSRKFEDFSRSSKEIDAGHFQELDLDDEGTKTDIGNDVIDLSYHDGSYDNSDNIVSSGNSSNNTNDLFNISQGEVIKDDEKEITVSNSDSSNQESNNSNEDGESDLSKFFR